MKWKIFVKSCFLDGVLLELLIGLVFCFILCFEDMVFIVLIFLLLLFRFLFGLVIVWLWDCSKVDFILKSFLILFDFNSVLILVIFFFNWLLIFFCFWFLFRRFWIFFFNCLLFLWSFFIFFLKWLFLDCIFDSLWYWILWFVFKFVINVLSWINVSLFVEIVLMLIINWKKIILKRNKHIVIVCMVKEWIEIYFILCMVGNL